MSTDWLAGDGLMTDDWLAAVDTSQASRSSMKDCLVTGLLVND